LHHGPKLLGSLIPLSSRIESEKRVHE